MGGGKCRRMEGRGRSKGKRYVARAAYTHRHKTLCNKLLIN